MITIKSLTSLEQSKKLAEFLPIESADMHWQYIEEDNGQLQWFYLPKDFSINENESIPAWSLSVLLKLLPSEFEETGSFGTFKYKIDIRKYKSTDEMDVYQIAYGNYLIGNSMGWKDMINTGWREDLLDAAFETILKLNELNLL